MAISNAKGQVIFSEPFDEVGGITFGEDNVGGVAWLSTCATCSDAGDYFRIVSGKLEAQDTNGPGIWETESIDISSCDFIEISIDLSEEGDMEACGTGCNSVDYVQFEYNIDGAGWTAPADAEYCAGDCAGVYVIQSDDIDAGSLTYTTGCFAGGDEIQLRITVQAWAGSERWQIDNVIVSCAEGPTVDAGEDVTICEDGEVTLLADNPDGAEITWTDGVVDGETFDAVTNTYTVTATSESGCFSTDDVTVTVAPNPIINAGDDLTVCPGEVVVLSGSGAGVGGVYLWDGGVMDGFGFVPVITTTYNVVGQTALGCENTDEITITVLSGGTINAGEDETICIGESIFLTGDGAGLEDDFTWDGGVVDGEVFAPDETATYTVTSLSDEGCLLSDAVTITVMPDPIINAGADAFICEGDEVTLSAAGAGAGGVYVWDGGVIDGVAFLPVATATYSVVGTTVDGCSNSDEITLTLAALPEVNFEAELLSGCSPFTTVFNALSIGETYSWTFGDGDIGYGESVSHTYTTDGEFDVALTITSAEGCNASLNLADYITAIAPPYTNFYFTPSDIYGDAEVVFDNCSENAVAYEWDFGDGSEVSSEENPVHFYSESGTGTYEVVLTSTNEFGCESTAVKLVVIAEEVLYFVPNAFTPDTDSYNANFTPVFAAGLDIYDFHLMIFNRWGELVFESYDVSQGWNGQYGNQGNAQDGVYVWRMQFGENMSDKRHTAEGHVLLMK